MRYVNVILNLFLIILFSKISNESFVCIEKMNDEKRIIENKVCSTRFISESFINTCKGNGFSSFVEWQANCKALFYLDSIEWKTEDNELFCGIWKGECSSGEVFCREEKIVYQ